MLRIKLSPFGKKHAISYRLVVVEDRSKITGRPVATLGHLVSKDSQPVVDKQLVHDWISKGAQPTATVRRLLGL